MNFVLELRGKGMHSGGATKALGQAEVLVACEVPVHFHLLSFVSLYV